MCEKVPAVVPLSMSPLSLIVRNGGEKALAAMQPRYFLRSIICANERVWGTGLVLSLGVRLPLPLHFQHQLLVF